MKKRSVLVAVVLVLLVLAGCSSPGDIVGEWVDSDGITWEFAEDGYVSQLDPSKMPQGYMYEMSGKKVTITKDDGTVIYTLELDGDELKQNDMVILTRA